MVIYKEPHGATLTGKTVLIAGGSGFVGSWLTEYYVARSANVICLDNLSTGRMKNIAHLRNCSNFRFVEHDVVDPFNPGGPVDFIFNLASPASPPKYRADPIRTFKTNILGANQLLELAQRTGARILQASTSEVYGDPAISPQVESYWGNVNTMGPRACYDEGKRAAETLFHEFQQRMGVDTRVARIFNTYGPGMDPDDGRVVSNFVVQALTGCDLTLYGDGSQTRSYCYVQDLVAGLTALMHTEGDLAMPVNLGNPVEFTVRQLAEMVIEETGSASGLVYHDLPQDDPTQRCPDITRAAQRLGWAPRVSLRDGLRMTIPYFAAEVAAPLKREAALA